MEPGDIQVVVKVQLVPFQPGIEVVYNLVFLRLAEFFESNRGELFAVSFFYF